MTGKNAQGKVVTSKSVVNGPRKEDGDGPPRGLSDQQRALRADKLGASEIAAVVGLDPYRSAADIYLEKTGQCEPFAGNDATRRGQYQEPGLCMFAQDETGVEFDRVDTTFVHESGLICATPDRISRSRQQGIEAKSTALTEGWGEAGTDQIPEKVLVQVAQQFLCVPTLQIIWIPVELIGFKSIEWQMFRVDRDGPSVPEMIAWVEENGLRFMRDYVLKNRKPEDYRPSLEVLKRVRRVPKKVIEGDPALVERCLKWRELAKLVAERQETADSCLLASMGDAEALDYPGGRVTYFETHRKGYEVKAATYRSLRFPQKKKLPPAPTENPEMLGDAEILKAIDAESGAIVNATYVPRDDEISGAIDEASGAVYSDADSGL